MVDESPVAQTLRGILELYADPRRFTKDATFRDARGYFTSLSGERIAGVQRGPAMSCCLLGAIAVCSPDGTAQVEAQRLLQDVVYSRRPVGLATFNDRYGLLAVRELVAEALAELESGEG